MTKFIFIYIIHPTKDEARKMAKHLLNKKLIACANIYGPEDSLYWWKGKLVDEKEYILIAKTKEENFTKVKNEVEKIHSYEIPCIIKIPVSSNQKYYDWLKSEIK